MASASTASYGTPAGLPHTTATSDEDLEGGESRPLLERRNSNDAQHFRNLQVAEAQNAASRLMWLMSILSFMIFGLVAFLIYAEVRSVYTLVVYIKYGCDQPLWTWLFVKLLLGPVTSALRLSPDPEETGWFSWCFARGRTCHNICQLVWIGLGLTWTSSAVTCQKTNPELFNWVRFVLILSMVMHVGSSCLFLLVHVGARLFVYFVRAGWIKNPSAAEEGTLDKIEVVRYRPELFAGDSSGSECCCCLERLDDAKIFLRTPCKHYFHKECLGEWLKLAKTCPLCRSDLEVSAASQSGSSGEAMVLEAGESSATGVAASHEAAQRRPLDDSTQLGR